MHTRLVHSLIASALVVAGSPAIARAQIGFPGGIRESGNQVVDAGRVVVTGAGVTGEGQPALTWLVGTSGAFSDNAQSFTGFVGLSWEGTIPVEAAVAYNRSEPDGLSGSNAFSATVEAVIPSAALAALGTKLSVSGEGVWVQDSHQSYSGAVSVTQALAKAVEVVGSAAYATTNPEAGASTSGIRPGASIAVVPVKGTSLRAEYTFNNDLDGEDSFAFRATQRLAPRGVPPFQLRGQVAKHGTVSFGIVFFP